jgi:hypothetical protein
VTGSNSIAIGANGVLKVAGPALQPGACVGWSVSSGHVQINHAGFYQGLVEAVTRVGVGLRTAILLGTRGFTPWSGIPTMPLAASVASTSIRTRRAYGLGIKALRLVAR